MTMEDLELVARGVVEGALQGLHRSPFIGFSVEFDAHREYQLGDDLRHVDWNLWARTDRLHVKQFKADTNLHLHLMLDTSASMLCGHGPSEKWRYGARAIAALAFLALRFQDAAGLYLLDRAIQNHIPPRLRPGQFHEILALLENAAPSGATDLGQALEEACQLCRRRGLVLLVSDLFDREEAIMHGLEHMRHYGHEVIVLQVLDPWEAALPEHGQYLFRDLETGETVPADVTPLRAAYSAALDEWQGGIRRRCENAGIDWMCCQTRDPLRDVLIEYLLKRSRSF